MDRTGTSCGLSTAPARAPKLFSLARTAGGHFPTSGEAGQSPANAGRVAVFHKTHDTYYDYYLHLSHQDKKTVQRQRGLPHAGAENSYIHAAPKARARRRRW